METAEPRRFHARTLTVRRPARESVVPGLEEDHQAADVVVGPPGERFLHLAIRGRSAQRLRRFAAAR